MIAIPLDGARQTLIQIGRIRGLSESESALLADHYLEGEMRGVKTHGIMKYLTLNRALRARLGKPIITRETAALITVDGQRELGPLAAHFCVDHLIAKSHQSGVALAALTNAGKYGCLATFGRRIAQAGLIGLIINSGGPANVAPFGGYQPILGSNPLCIAVPSERGEPLIVDMGTSESPWSRTLLARMLGQDLPPDTFYDAGGHFTTDPNAARATRPFGGAKGYALSLALEILCGAFTGAPMGRAIHDEYDCGFVFLAFDPSLTGRSIGDFHSEIAQLEADIRDSQANERQPPVRLPGERSQRRMAEAERANRVEVEERFWEAMQRMAADPDAEGLK